ncbi:MAG: hypothetical protein K6L80_11500 [Agarilytica sp.]
MLVNNQFGLVLNKGDFPTSIQLGPGESALADQKEARFIPETTSEIK